MITDLLLAQKNADVLFKEAGIRGYIAPGITEKDLNTRLFDLAEELFGIKKYWHKRIIRSGPNTLLPYKENPPDLVLQENDILFFDFGPVFEEWEADYGRTYVIGSDPAKLKLKHDVEAAWYAGQQYFRENYSQLTGAGFYAYTKELAAKMGWEFGNIHCGHLIGNFPHEQVQGDEVRNYIHPDNPDRMAEPDGQGRKRYWIYEIHLVDRARKIGGFFEQLVSFDDL
jgi:Xaa-Pro dipeptidase